MTISKLTAISIIDILDDPINNCPGELDGTVLPSSVVVVCSACSVLDEIAEGLVSEVASAGLVLVNVGVIELVVIEVRVVAEVV